jgi:hypothetical protein
MEHKLAYWAPELLTMQQYGKEVDCWALGVVGGRYSHLSVPSSLWL